MNHANLRPHCIGLVVLLVAVFESACGVPLAPGYKIVKETRDVHFISGSAPHIEIRSHFELQNSGTAPLPFIDLKFPEKESSAADSFTAILNGRPANLSPLPEEYRQDNPDTLRINFDAAWARGAGRQLDLEYSLGAPERSGSRFTIGQDNFHLGSLGWMVLPQPPHHLLTAYPKRPAKTSYSVLVPSNFLVLARGKLASRKREGQETRYVFHLRQNDLGAYVVSGRYFETAARAASGTVVFWTLQPLKISPGSAPERIARAWATLQSDFGPLDPNIHSFHVVESPEVRPDEVFESGPAAGSFPGGALVDENALALGISSDAFIELVLHAMAHNWFGGQMYPTGASGLAMSEGLPEYATIVIDEATSGPARRNARISNYLRRYRDALERAAEKPLGVITPNDNRDQRTIALAKAPLMYVALEDTCGETPVRNGLKNLVTLLRGQEVGFDDMRSAIEATCKKDLGEFFRRWLYQKGLPEEFRIRYESGQNGGG